uniref:Sclerostin domain containing 1b n=1 Tax=Myripristis murdjan TaxID=586833 RepID=A0A667ZH67_9TELE
MLLLLLPQLLLLLLVALRCCRAVQNDPQEEPAVNRARNGGRRLGDSERNGPEQSQMGCRELRSTKYISDGQCTSINPIKELVCAGECLPAHLLPNWIGGGGYTGRYWSRREAQEWRCVIDRTRSQRIRLQCQDGSSRTYKITVVTSCKCKRYSRQQNDSGHESEVQGKSQTVHGAKRRKEHKTRPSW